MSRDSLVFLVPLFVCCSCQYESSLQPHPQAKPRTDRVPDRILIHYHGGHFAPSRYSVTAEQIRFAPGGQYNSGPLFGRSTPTLLANTYRALQRNDLKMSRILDVEQAIRSTPPQHYRLIVTWANGESYTMLIPHSETVRRNGVTGRRKWFGELIDDLEVMARYLNENR
jgi:hypothetical protein